VIPEDSDEKKGRKRKLSEAEEGGEDGEDGLSYGDDKKVSSALSRECLLCSLCGDVLYLVYQREDSLLLC